MTNDALLRKWRLILGGSNKSDGGEGTGVELNGRDAKVDKALNMLYGDADGDRSNGERKGGLEESSPNVNRWLGDIREFFPSSVVKVMQQDALKRLNLQAMLLEKEMLENVEPDVNLVSTLMTLSKVIPETTKETARIVIRKVVEEIMRRIEQRTHQAITGSINRSSRIRNPKFKEINWHTTILKNLKHYQPEYKTVIPEQRIGYGKKRRSLKDVVLCIDQSGSMGTSVVYSGIFGSVMASIPALKTRMVVFDTAVTDLTEELQDPVELLFGVQLGGGTDIDRALTYCQQVIAKPNDTILVLITDLYEGGNVTEMRKRMASIVASGVQLIVLLALNDEGAPYYDHANAEFLAAIGVPVFACTPDKFPDLMAAAINKQDIGLWASQNELAMKK
jgi:Mg-chelatase subunit ChlD